MFKIDQGRLAAFERQKWSQWVMQATEDECRRRIEENNNEEVLERLKRQEWARQASAAEQKRVIQEKAITSIEDTPWFQKMTSSYHDDYIVVCPNSYLGCSHSCPRSQVVQHLKSCEFSGERRAQIRGDAPSEDTRVSAAHKVRDWIVVCPCMLFWM